ncbi:MAG TPA: histidine ammonia-lyase, partial [Acidimicrobiales bacterium]|nr:histidine ammonia-lyase [Acidimicrobiales bacterium]
AAMVAENRRRSMPASVDTMTTSALQEDHVSLGWEALRRLRTMVEDLGRILAVELVAAARGIELREHNPAPATAAAVATLRSVVPGVGPDRVQAPELEAAHRLVAEGTVLAAVEAVTGELR